MHSIEYNKYTLGKEVNHTYDGLCFVQPLSMMSLMQVINNKYRIIGFASTNCVLALHSRKIPYIAIPYNITT